MKAAVYYETGGPEVLRYEDVPDPGCFPGAVVIEVAAISIEGGDTLNRAGGEMTSNPHIVGYQCAGTIVEVGDGVEDRQVGQNVVATMLSGSHAERAATFAGVTWPVPDGADLTKVACVPVAFGTAHEALFALGKLEKGERVLIHAGAGGVGLAAIQLAGRRPESLLRRKANVRSWVFLSVEPCRCECVYDTICAGGASNGHGHAPGRDHLTGGQSLRF